MSEAVAVAHPNIALVKYWGKQEVERNLPAAGSLSITLDTLETRTRVEFSASLPADELQLDGRAVQSGDALHRVERFLDMVRARAGVAAHARVVTQNNFPTRAGLASSASGFAALAAAACEALELDLTPRQMSALARRGSGSAARSIFGGYVRMDAGSAEQEREVGAHQLAGPEHWDLDCVIAVADTGEKAVGSTDGMMHTAETSPYYDAWLEVVGADLESAEEAVDARDFETLRRVTESNCLRMHASAMAAEPGLIYWNPTTLRVIQALRARRTEGALRETMFTIDAGPHVKLFTPTKRSDEVADWVIEVDGVEDVLRTGVGRGARAVESTVASEDEGTDD